MSKSITGLFNQFVSEYKPDLIIYFKFAGLKMRVKTNSSRLARQLVHYFRSFKSEEDSFDVELVAIDCDEVDLGISFTEWEREPDKTRGKEEFCDFDDGRVVRKVRTGMQFILGRNKDLAVGPCLENCNQVINFINFQYTIYMMNKDYLLCHSAGITKNGKGVSISAVSGGGKSTLALKLISSGYNFVSNDRVLIKKDEAGHVHMSGVPKFPRINPGTILNNPDLKDMLGKERKEELLAMSKEELWDLEEKYDADILEIYGEDRFELTAPLDFFIVLNWSHKNKEPARFTKVNLADEVSILAPVKKGPGPFFLDSALKGTSGWQELDDLPYISELEKVPVYKFEGGVDFEFAKAKITELLK